MDKKYIGLIVGLIFTALIAGLIVYGNFFASSETPQRFTWKAAPVLHICDTAPTWARPGQPDFDKAIKFWDQRGWAFSSIETGPCPTTCKVTKDGKEIEKVCTPGKVTLDIMDQWFEPDHAGRCSFPEHMLTFGTVGPEDWTTITVPEVILGSDSFGEAEPGEFGEAPPDLPPEANAVVLTHEIGHCLVGLEHNLGPSLGCGGAVRLNPKTGHVMNPSIYKGGWGDEALPTPTWK